MATKAVYFTHMSNAVSDEKIVRLRRKYGMQGYGIYFAILEKLSTTNGYKLPVDSISDVAFDINTDENIVTDVVKNFNLFECDEGYFYSNAHRLFMCYKDEKSEAKRKGAMARLEKLSAEELRIQNTKAARKRWDDVEKQKREDASRMQAQQASDANKMQTMQAVNASDALDKDIYKDMDKDIDKDIDTDKEKDVDKEKSLSSGLVSEEPIRSVYLGEKPSLILFQIFLNHIQGKYNVTYTNFEIFFIWVVAKDYEERYKKNLNREQLVNYVINNSDMAVRFITKRMNLLPDETTLMTCEKSLERFKL